MSISLKFPGKDVRQGSKRKKFWWENDGETYPFKGKEQGLPGPQNEVTLTGLGYWCQRKRGHGCLNSTAQWQSYVQHPAWIATYEGPESALSTDSLKSGQCLIWGTNMKYTPKDKLEWLLTHIIRGQIMSLFIACVLFLPVSRYW